MLFNFEFNNQTLNRAQLLLALDQVIPTKVIMQAIRTTDSERQRQRILPTHVVISLIVAMSFWSDDSIVDVLKNLIDGLNSLQIPFLKRFKIPTSSSISEARQRVGAAVMTRLFEIVSQLRWTGFLA